jgi:uncharacterized radical SAM superfamily Fe-S cluster-containing enzyme
MVVTGYNEKNNQLQVTQVYSEFDALTDEVSVKFHSTNGHPIPEAIAKYASKQTRRVLEFKRTTTTSFYKVC